MTFREALREAGRAYLERVLVEKRGNVSKAAMEAGISRTHFYKCMARYDVPNSGRARVKS